MIQPLGNQIIIRTLPPESWKGIIIPDSSRGSTIVGAKGAEDAAHFVEAEVIAVGPGMRRKGDPDVVDDMVALLENLSDGWAPVKEAQVLIDRAKNRTGYLEPMVKPGDRVLYHPAVKSFDREIDGHHIGLGDGDYYICGEHSILAVLEP